MAALFRFVALDGDPNQAETPDSIAVLEAVDSRGTATGSKIKVTSWMLGQAFAHTPHFKGYTEGQVFSIDVKPVLIVPPGPAEVVPVTDGDQVGLR